MTSTSESTKPSPRVETAAVVTHGQVDVESGVERLRNVAKRSGVTLVDDARDADLTIVLGGDGTMLRTLARLLGSEVPVLGVNYGRVGFLASIPPADLERDLERAFAGEYVTVPLPTLQVRLDGERYIAVNDVVVTSSTLGKMIELAWAIGGEDLGVVPCDGMICSTPSGSTAYNLSNGGPVLVRGLDAMAVTFIAPHSLHARPFVVPRGVEVTVANATVAVAAALLVDGQRVAEVAPGDEVGIYLAEERSLLATLPETSFFSRYRETFSS
jgi:NAD+ kinase